MQNVPERSSWGWPQSIFLLLILLGFVAFFTSGAQEVFDYQRAESMASEFSRVVGQHPLLTSVVFVFLYTVFTVLALPASAGMIFFAGFTYGPWWGCALVSVASTFAAGLSFVIARHLFRSMIEARHGHRIQRIAQGRALENGWLLFFMRATPIVPFPLVNYAMGLSRISFLKFMLITWGGTLPVIAFWIFGARWMLGFLSQV